MMFLPEATILDWIEREGGTAGSVVSVDRHHPDLVPWYPAWLGGELIMWLLNDEPSNLVVAICPFLSSRH